MKILHVITSLHIGGAEKLMLDLLPRLKERGYEVSLFLFDGTDTPFHRDLISLGIRVICSSVGTSVYNPIHILRLRKILKNYDIVHTHNFSPQLFSAIARIGIRNVYFCTTEHSTSNRRRSWKWYTLVDRWMYRQYNCVIAVSGQAANNLLNHLKYEGVSIYQIPNGINVNRYFRAFPSPEILERFPHSNLICMVASFRTAKDHYTLIKSMQLLSEKYQLLLVGEGDTQKSCQAYANNLGVNDRVHFLGMRTDIPEILKAASVVVLSSHYEGLPLSSIEGMASSRPFIASDVDGLREVVDGYGILFPHEDAIALASDIKRVCENKTFREEVVARCENRALMYDINITADQYDQLYCTLCKP